MASIRHLYTNNRMNFFKRNTRQNYDIYSFYSWFVPGIKGMFILLALLIVGACLGSLVTNALKIFGDIDNSYSMLLSYPIMFIPPMVASGYLSSRNIAFEKGYALDNNHFGKYSVWITALLLIASTFMSTFLLDLINSVLPKMPEKLKDLMDSLLQGNIWVNAISVCIFAPFFEEWLCRGMILRGLLNHRRKDGTSMKPIWAIIISALFFAVIHFNPWQAIPAFLLGCFMGFVYYKTGSLKFTMLIHFVNNAIALIMGNIANFKDAESWRDILPENIFFLLCIISIIIIAITCIYIAKTIKVVRPQGSCKEII